MLDCLSLQLLLSNTKETMQSEHLHVCVCISCVLTYLPACVMFLSVYECEPVCGLVRKTTGHWPQVAEIWQSLLVRPLKLLSEPQHTDLRESDREQKIRTKAVQTQSFLI